jgi:hypothetical protein
MIKKIIAIGIVVLLVGCKYVYISDYSCEKSKHFPCPELPRYGTFLEPILTINNNGDTIVRYDTIRLLLEDSNWIWCPSRKLIPYYGKD